MLNQRKNSKFMKKDISKVNIKKYLTKALKFIELLLWLLDLSKVFSNFLSGKIAKEQRCVLEFLFYYALLCPLYQSDLLLWLS